MFAQLPKVRAECALSSCVFRIASNVIASHRRRERLRAAKLAEAHVNVNDIEHGGDALERPQLRAAVHALPGNYQQSFILHDVHGYTHNEIASAIGVPVGTSKCRLTCARRKLRVALT